MRKAIILLMVTSYLVCCIACGCNKPAATQKIANREVVPEYSIEKIQDNILFLAATNEGKQYGNFGGYGGESSVRAIKDGLKEITQRMGKILKVVPIEEGYGNTVAMVVFIDSSRLK